MLYGKGVRKLMVWLTRYELTPTLNSNFKVMELSRPNLAINSTCWEALVKLLVLQLGALNIDIRHRLIDPLRNPPGGLVQDGHGSWDK